MAAGSYSGTPAPHPCFALLCEAKTLASLNHPNITIIHRLEKAPGTYALVMEFVDGSSRELANCAVARKLPE
jgi:serine/threonine protein kinase